MDYMMTGSKAVLDAAAKLKEDYLYNVYHMGNRQITRAEQADGSPYAYVIDPAEQHDPGAAVQLLRTLRRGGVEIRRAERAFAAGGQEFASGAYVIPPQAYRPFVVDLMESKQYPDRFLFPGGPPEQPYDLTGYNLPDQFGVTFHRVNDAFEMPGPAVDVVASPEGAVKEAPGGATWGYLLSNAPNASVVAKNRLLAAGANVAWAAESFVSGGREWPAGTIVVRGAEPARLEELAAEFGLEFAGVATAPSSTLWRLDAPRVGIYQSYTGNMAEGWTRWVLDEFEFDVEVLHDEDIRAGDLQRFHIILLPDQGAESILNGHAALRMPQQYVGGLGAEGAAALKSYVENGGWVMAFHQAVEFAASMFGLPVRNGVAGVDGRQFYVPGSLIRFAAESSDPLAFGMAPESTALFWRHGLVMNIVPAAGEGSSAAGSQKLEHDISVYARFADEKVLADGWAIGGDRYLAGRPAAMRVPLGRGQVVLIGFRPDTRGQSANAFKLLFNPLFAPTIGPGELFR